jgi:hypothetical protein
LIKVEIVDRMLLNCQCCDGAAGLTGKLAKKASAGFLILPITPLNSYIWGKSLNLSLLIQFFLQAVFSAAFSARIGRYQLILMLEI